MTIIALKILFLTSLFFLTFFSFSAAIKQEKINYRFLFSTLLLVGFSIAFYIRFIVFKDVIFASPDEANYIDILYNYINTKTGVISGPAYVQTLVFLNSITKIDIMSLIPGYGFVISLLSFPIIFFLFESQIKDRNKSFMSSLLLLTTTYFIWPIIESRPQQLGMILLFASAIIFYKFISSRNIYFIPFIVLYILTYAYHILSFFVLLVICFLIAYWKFLNKEEGSGKKLIYFSIASIALLYHFVIPGSFYAQMYGGMLYIIVKYPLCLLKLPLVTLSIFVTALILFAIATLTLRYLISKINFKKILLHPAFITVSIISLITALGLQYKMVSGIHNSLYLNSRMYFFIFESGNIFYGVLFLLGFFKTVKSGDEKNIFFQYSIALMVLGGSMVIVSMFFPGQFNNGLIRVINYWTIFAAPIALIPITDFYLKNNKRKFYILIATSFFAIISIVAASRDPMLFNYQFYWNKYDFSAVRFTCNQDGFFYIHNNTDSNIVLSKLNSYGQLISILRSKKEIQRCKGTILTPFIVNSDNQVVFTDGDVTVYRAAPQTVADLHLPTLTSSDNSTQDSIATSTKNTGLKTETTSKPIGFRGASVADERCPK